MSSTDIIAIDALRYGWRADEPMLRIDRFRLKDGQHVFVHGASGRGKSTFLSLLTGVLLPDQGDCVIDGQSLSAMRAAARDQFRVDTMGIIFQTFNLLPYLSAIDNVLLPLGFSAKRRGNVTGDIQAEAKALLGELGLQSEALSRATQSLSIGQQQRVAAARALLGTPKLIIADEPTSALDTEHQQRFIQKLMQLAAAHGSSVVMVSHDPRLAAYFDHQLDIEDFRA